MLRFARYLVEKIGVAVVPGRAFTTMRLMARSRCALRFARRDETLAAAEERLKRLHA